MKINCTSPNHKDETPSMHVYSDGAWCFVCGFKCSLEELEKEYAEEIKNINKKEPENIEEKMRYISTLSKRKIRGLDLPVDDSGYYICWPDKNHYKLRRFDDRPRYVGPRGSKAPIFCIRSKYTCRTIKTGVIVEGELNALSLELAFRDHRFHIVSPGSVNEMSRHFEFYLQFSKIYIIVDRDAAGVVNGLKLKDDLRKKGKSVTLIALEEDFNDMLQRNGTEEIKKQLKKELGFK